MLTRCNVSDLECVRLNKSMNKVIVDGDVFHARVKDRIGTQISGTNVVRENIGRRGRQKIKLM